MIGRVRAQVAEHELQLELDRGAKELLVDKGWDPAMGARPLRRAIQRYIEDPLADEVLQAGRHRAREPPSLVERDPTGDEDERPLKLKIVKPPRSRRRSASPRRSAWAPRRRRRRLADDDGGDPPPATTPPSNKAIGTWSGGRFMHFGEALDDERLLALLRPGDGIDTVLTADTYGQGEADRCSAARSRASTATRSAWSARSATTSTKASARAQGLPALHRPALRGPDDYAGYLRMAAERSLERLGADRFDLLLLHNPDRTGYTSEAVWDGMAALRDAGLTRLHRRRPRAGQRLHARRHRLPGALRRPHRLGDGDPQPARAVAGRARAARGARATTST